MKKAFLTMILFFYSLLAHGGMSGDCEYQFHSYGSGQGDDKITSTCIEWAFDRADYNAIRNSNEGDFKGLGFNSFVVLENAAGQKLFISGSNTLLSDVRAIRFHKKSGQIYVLSSIQGKVFAFDLSIPGNVAPSRVLEAPEMIGADDLEVSADGTEVYILHSKQKEIFVFDGTKNLRGRKELREMKLIRSHSFTGHDFISFALDHTTSRFHYLTRDARIVMDNGLELKTVALTSEERESLKALEWNSRESALEGRNRTELVFKVGR